MNRSAGLTPPTFGVKGDLRAAGIHCRARALTLARGKVARPAVPSTSPIEGARQLRRDREATRLSRYRDRAIDDLSALTDTRPHVVRHRDDAATDLARLTNTTIDTIVARSRQAAQPDGYPQSALGEGTGRSGNITNRTATTAERHAGGSLHFGTPDTWREQPDPVRDTIREIGILLTEIFGLAKQLAAAEDPADVVAVIAKKARKVDLKRQYVTSAPKVVRWSTKGDCQACQHKASGDENDRLRAGYCRACYEAWRYADFPDRPQFEKARRERLTA